MEDFKRNPSESELQFLWRIGQAKESGIIEITWQEIADILNEEFRDPDELYTESAYRKKYNNLKQGYDEIFSEQGNAEQINELRNLQLELEKEKVKVRDERNEFRRLIREQARRESYMDQFVRAITESASSSALEYEDNARFHGTLKSDNDMIISLTDIHAGIGIDNFWNEYNEETIKERLNHYLDRIFEIQLRHGSMNAYIVLSEVVSGNIHPTLRIVNNQDLIDQFLMITDYISDFIAAVSYRFNKVYVYVAPGNHSRITAKKEESLDHENLDNLLVPFLRAKLQNFDNVELKENTIEQGIALFSVRNQIVAAVHGDKDTMDTVADRLMHLLHVSINICLVGHRHTNGYISRNNVKIIQSGCLSGTDDYAISCRLNNRPEQAVCIISDEEGLDCVYDVKF